LVELSGKAHELASNEERDKLREVEEEINREVARLFGLNEEEVGGVKEALRVVINKNSNSLYIRNKLPHKMLTKITQYFRNNGVPKT